MKPKIPLVLSAIGIVSLVGGIAGWLVLRSQPAPASKNETVRSTAESETKVNPNEHNYIDVDFAQKMIVHNQQGVQMADIAAKNATSGEVRRLAVSISEELSANTTQYIDWLTKWKEIYFNLSDFPEMDGHDMYPTHPGMASLSDLATLKSATGGSVDELFLRLMITHHEGSNEIANAEYLKGMQFGEMVHLKNETLKRQTREIEIMKRLQTKGE